jgi:spore cortex formation protein SpoVR/YcgB (stage V sporulation)
MNDQHNTRKLTLMYYKNSNKELSKSASRVLRHIEYLWGFTTEMVDQDSKNYTI